MAGEGDDHYATLGVMPGANARTIRTAYKALAQRCHPDKAGGADPDAMARMAAINAAYRVLGDPRLRSAYDQQRARERREAEARTGDGQRGRRHRRRARRGLLTPSPIALALEQLLSLLLLLLMITFVAVFVALLFVELPQPHVPKTAIDPARGKAPPPSQPQTESHPFHYE